WRGHERKVVGAECSPDGARLVTASADCTVRQWEVATGREIGTPYDRHVGEVTTAVYSPDGKWIASAGVDRTIRVWQANGRHDVAGLRGQTTATPGHAVDPGARPLASVGPPPKPVLSPVKSSAVGSVSG